VESYFINLKEVGLRYNYYLCTLTFKLNNALYYYIHLGYKPRPKLSKSSKAINNIDSKFIVKSNSINVIIKGYSS